MFPDTKFAHIRFVRGMLISYVVRDEPQALAEVELQTTIVTDVLSPGKMPSRPLTFFAKLEHKASRTQNCIKYAYTLQKSILRHHCSSCG